MIEKGSRPVFREVKNTCVAYSRNILADTICQRWALPFGALVRSTVGTEGHERSTGSHVSAGNWILIKDMSVTMWCHTAYLHTSTRMLLYDLNPVLPSMSNERWIERQAILLFNEIVTWLLHVMFRLNKKLIIRVFVFFLNQLHLDSQSQRGSIWASAHVTQLFVCLWLLIIVF